MYWNDDHFQVHIQDERGLFAPVPETFTTDVAFDSDDPSSLYTGDMVGALDGVPSHREPGWVPLDVVLRGATHESKKTRLSYPRAFNTTLRIGDVTGDGRSDLLIADHPRLMGVHVGVPGSSLVRHAPGGVGRHSDEDGKRDVLMHHPFTLRDGHGARRRPPGTEPHRVTVLIAR